jgi:hypothetical protein
MSEENVEIAKRLYPGPINVVEALQQPEAWREFFEPFIHSDFETVGSPGTMPMSGTTVIPDGSVRAVSIGWVGFIDAFKDWLDAWDQWVATPADFIRVDADRVLVLIDIKARSKTHQVEMPIDGANLLTFKDGKVARLELFLERDKAYEAAGIPA